MIIIMIALSLLIVFGNACSNRRQRALYNVLCRQEVSRGYGSFRVSYIHYAKFNQTLAIVRV